MIESTFWYVEPHELDQGLWDDIICHEQGRDFKYTTFNKRNAFRNTIKYRALAFNDIYDICRIYESYLPITSSGVTEHD